MRLHKIKISLVGLQICFTIHDKSDCFNDRPHTLGMNAISLLRQNKCGCQLNQDIRRCKARESHVNKIKKKGVIVNKLRRTDHCKMLHS